MKLQTVKYDSLFTRLDFRSKLVVMLSVTILAFLWESPIAGGLLMLSVIASCVLAGVRLNYLGTILKVMIPFYIFLILSMGFFNVEQVKLLTQNRTHNPFELATNMVVSRKCKNEFRRNSLWIEYCL